jgi:signal transduction histidine kinase
MRSPLSGFDELRRLVNFSALINSSLDIQTVLNQAMDYVEYLLEAEASSIFEVDPEQGDLFFRLARGEKAQALKGMRLQMGEGVAGTVALTEDPLLVTDTSQDPRFCQRFDGCSGFYTRSILCVPLKSRERLVGVLEVLNKKDPRGFDETDCEILTLVGNLIGTALENARLYGRLQDRLSATREELKIAQEKLLRSERLAALGKLSQGVAHEVRNPITIIGGFVHRLEKHLPTDDPHQATLEIINAQVHKLEQMVREIEAFTKLGEPVLRVTRLPELIDRVLTAQASQMQKAQVEVHTAFPSMLPPVPADPELLSLALGNLVTNALEAMPNGGNLEINLAAEPSRVRLSVKDTGVGIASADLPRVFDPFFSSKPQGTGMGLTAVHHIIANHLGEIEIESKPGQGTTVHLWLPRWSPE